jgi:hypothetical protein
MKVVKNSIKKIFFWFNRNPKRGCVYAITAGAYLGELLVFVEEEETGYNFLSLPKMENRSIPSDKFCYGLENRIVERVKKLPKSVYAVCRLQYIKNKSGALPSIPA